MASAYDEDEATLRSQLNRLAETDAAYAAALNDLAVLQLNKGEVAEAQGMFEKLRALRADQLDEPSPAAAADAAPLSPAPPVARPRVNGAGGLGGGVAMFAKALGGGSGGGRPRSARPAGSAATASAAVISTTTAASPAQRNSEDSSSGPGSSGSRSETPTSRPTATASSAPGTPAKGNHQHTASGGRPAAAAAGVHLPPRGSGSSAPHSDTASPARAAAAAAPTRPSQPHAPPMLSAAADSTASAAVAAALAGATGGPRAGAGVGSPAGVRSRSPAPAPAPVAAASASALGSGKGNGTAANGTGAATRGDEDGSDSWDLAAEPRGGQQSYGECRHVVEVYGLTTDTKTTHLEEFVEATCPQDGRPLPLVKWVDDNHALLVCFDQATAMLLLQDEQDLFALRPFADASPGAKATALTELLPPRERPKTTAAVAKKMLSHALGMSQLRDRDGEKDLAARRKAAKEARREREAKLASAWDDD